MSKQNKNSPAQPTSARPKGYLLLRDLHAVPLYDLSPDALKASREQTITMPEKDLKHQKGLDAIVQQFGFKGDYGDYKNTGWPRLQVYLHEHGCKEQRDLFLPDDCGNPFFFWSKDGASRRNLADRVFYGAKPVPTRVFLGVGIDWGAWFDEADTRPGHWSIEDGGAELFPDPTNRAEAIDFVFRLRTCLMGEWGFLDDKLVAGQIGSVIPKTYWTTDTPTEKRERYAVGLKRLMTAFRMIFDAGEIGWVDILLPEFAPRLAILRNHLGQWDFVWADLRTAEPPVATGIGARYGLHVRDTPMALLTEGDRARSQYFRVRAWDECERHEAEKHFYAQGGKGIEHPGGEAILERYLLDMGRLAAPVRASWDDGSVPGFTQVQVGGKSLLVSALVTINEFEQMARETGYLERRSLDDERLDRANDGEDGDLPVGLTWRDAMAFIAWKERQLRVSVRLLSHEEHRAIRPFHHEHYAQMAQQDFPWERYPPRPLRNPTHGDTTPHLPVPSAVEWSEPRFLPPGPNVPEFPDAYGMGVGGRKVWHKDFPPAGSWTSPLPNATYAGLTFIDAWDAYEWVSHPRGPAQVAGRFWEGHIGLGSWGAYKNAKVAVRCVIEVATAK
jgi:hypothetical protein